MHPIRLLLKTTAKTLPLIGSFGGSPVFTTTDAAWTLAGLDSYAVTFAYWRYCGDDAKENEVKEHLTMIAGHLALDKKLKLKPATIISLVDSTIEQYKRPLCVVCEGRSFVPGPDKSPVVCTACKGHGKKILNKSEIAKNANLNRRAITDSHLSMISDLSNVLVSWERQVVAHVAKRID